jgi:hypothetical protein
MRQEEAGFLPDLGDQLIQIVRGRRAGAGADDLVGRRVGDQPIAGVVDQLAFLLLLDRLDGQADLLHDMVVRYAIQVGDTCMDVRPTAVTAQRLYSRRFSS